MLLRLDTDEWWPVPLKDRFHAYKEALLTNEYMETLIESAPFSLIAEELEDFIREHTIVGYHCTREPELGFYSRNGLRILDRQAHQAEFLCRYSIHFTSAEIQEIKQAWQAYFTGIQENGRNGRLWFCLAPDQVVGRGTRHLFGLFGGEAIYMPLVDHPTIAGKLRAIGEPVVVETSINPNELKTFSRVPLALNAMSLAHHRINGEAHIHGREGNLSRNVSSTEIIRVTPKDVFFSAYYEGQ